VGFSIRSDLVGGFNPIEKYVRQIGNLPQIGVPSDISVNCSASATCKPFFPITCHTETSTADLRVSEKTAFLSKKNRQIQLKYQNDTTGT